MLHYFSLTSHTIEEYQSGKEIDPDSLWVDLFNPEIDEVKMVENLFQLKLPTEEAMREIEASSRLYIENDLLYMTFNVLTTTIDDDHPFLSPITFILCDEHLITVRYANPKPFEAVVKKLERNTKRAYSSELIFLMMLETIVDRIADFLELIGSEVDMISNEIFNRKQRKADGQPGLHEILTEIGKKGDMSTKTRESLNGISRLLKFYTIYAETPKIVLRVNTLQEDVKSISDHVYFLFNKINFLLDATLGYINIEQNHVVKILSGAAVIFLPPTLIASIYGMNFQDIPELGWAYGYPYALSLMIITAVLPYLYFKKKGWL